MKQSRFQKGVEKIIDFPDPVFFRFWLIWGAQGGQKVFVSCLFFGSFSILGAIFFARAPFWLILMGFGAFGIIFQ